MSHHNTSNLVRSYNPIANGVAERYVGRLVGQPVSLRRHLWLVPTNKEKSSGEFVKQDQHLRGNVRGGELLDFTFSGWVRNLVSSVAETENTMTNLINKSGPELVTIYNTVAKLLGQKDVQRFATKSAAVDRTARLLAMLNAKSNTMYDQTCVALGLKDAPKAEEPKVTVVEAPAISLEPALKPAPAPEAPKPAIKPPVKATPKATKSDGIDAVEDKAHAKAVAAPKAPAATKTAAKASAAPTTGEAPKAPGRPRDFNFKPFSVHRVPRTGSYLAEALTILTKGCQYADMVTLVNELDAKRGRGTLAKGSDSVDRRAYELIRDLHFLNGYGIRHNADNGLIESYTFAKG